MCPMIEDHEKMSRKPIERFPVIGLYVHNEWSTKSLCIIYTADWWMVKAE